MLSKILSKETCGQCRFCCAFRRCSLWETPYFEKKVVDKYSGHELVFNTFKMNDLEYGMLNYEGKYHTNDSEEEAKCGFLCSETGCVLNDEEKPFDCKIWPLRIMRKDEKLVIALTPTCPAINKYSSMDMKNFVEEGIGDVIYEYAMAHPYIIKEYRDGFPVLKIFENNL